MGTGGGGDIILDIILDEEHLPQLSTPNKN